VELKTKTAEQYAAWLACERGYRVRELMMMQIPVGMQSEVKSLFRELRDKQLDDIERRK